MKTRMHDPGRSRPYQVSDDSRGATGYHVAVTGLSAELAYLFRHALLRDAAYEMQLPSDRAKLHEMAFHLIEQAFGGRAPEPPPLDDHRLMAYIPHTSDAAAQELYHHAQLAGAGSLARQCLPLYLRRAAEHAERSFQMAPALQLWQELARQADGSIRAAALRRCGTVALQAGLLSVVETSLTLALDQCRQARLRHLEGLVMGTLASVYRETGRRELAESHLDAALEVYREVGDKDREGGACADLATIYQQSARIAEAEASYLRGLDLLRATGNRRFEAVALSNLGNALLQTGRLQEAEEAYRRSLELARQTRDRRIEGATLGNLGIVFSETGRRAESLQAYLDALSISRETGNRRSEGINLGHLGSHHHDAGDLQQAEECFLRSLEIHRELGNIRFEASVSCSLSLTLLRTGRLDQARRTWAAGQELFERIGDRFELERKAANMRKVCASAGVPPFDEGAP